MAEDAMRELAGLDVSAKRIRSMVIMVGESRLTERKVAVERLKQMPLPQRRSGSAANEVSPLAVISMDGGRYQRRDQFRNVSSGPRMPGHWRETKVGCLLSMNSVVFHDDPAPEFPEWLATSETVAELAKIGEKPGFCEENSLPEVELLSSDTEPGYEPPELLSREVVASSEDAESFGWQLEARSWQLGFPSAERQVFIGDGAKVNWSIQREHFPRAIPITDLMHALSYAWSAAAAVNDRNVYRQWAEWIWSGEVSRVIADLTKHQQRLGAPSPDADSRDPQQLVHRALTYYTNNQRRMDYPTYRRQGLPLTSSHIESTVKQINRRVKGTEKFWSRDSGEAVLQLRADSLSDSKPLTHFWRRWQAQQTGSNRYHSAA
jgi:hypothetical protein